MALVVKRRIRGDGRIWLDRVKTKVLRATGGWYAVDGASPSEDARVLFRPAQDLLVIEQYGRFLRVPFHAGEATFTWEDRTFHIGSMARGALRIDREGRVVAHGVVTAAGVRFSDVACELLPLIRPLAWALALRGEVIARDARRMPPGGAGAR
ncbi:MAG TPA: hypothetical protein VEY12_10375 [Thermoplasmata archaeon]|nr:hypothetical protein [Thermoplasmata archaeon]